MSTWALVVALSACALFCALPALLYQIERCRLNRDCREVANHPGPCSGQPSVSELLTNETDH